MTLKKALIAGITGQDGSYLAELLLDKGHEVHGIIRRASTFNTRRIYHIYVDPHVAGHRVREFLSAAFEHVGLNWQEFVRFDQAYERPAEVDSLVGDPTRARELLGWKPTVLMPELARIMVDADVQMLDSNAGHRRG